MRETLMEMEKASYLEHGGAGRGAYWTLRPELHKRLIEAGQPERDRRIDWERLRLAYSAYSWSVHAEGKWDCKTRKSDRFSTLTEIRRLVL